MIDYSLDVEELAKDGYITKDGEPLKCRYCKGKNFKESDEWFDHKYKVEFQVSCDDCKKKLSIWSYGYWYLLENER